MSEASPAGLPPVSIGFPCGSQIPWQTAMSLTNTAYVLATRGITLRMETIAGSSLVTHARDIVANSFLNQNETDRLFWIDSDIQWLPAQFVRMLELSQRYPVVCATYPMKRPDCAFVIKHPDLQTFEMTRDGLLRVQGAGLGFTIVWREVMEKLAANSDVMWDEAGNREFRNIFRLDKRVNAQGRKIAQGEDMAFFQDVMALGYDVWLDPTIELGHVGSHVYRADPVVGLKLEHVYSKGSQCPATTTPQST